jgi:hypothetical protein
MSHLSINASKQGIHLQDFPSLMRSKPVNGSFESESLLFRHPREIHKQQLSLVPRFKRCFK